MKSETPTSQSDETAELLKRLDRVADFGGGPSAMAAASAGKIREQAESIRVLVSELANASQWVLQSQTYLTPGMEEPLRGNINEAYDHWKAIIEWYASGRAPSAPAPKAAAEVAERIANALEPLIESQVVAHGPYGVAKPMDTVRAVILEHLGSPVAGGEEPVVEVIRIHRCECGGEMLQWRHPLNPDSDVVLRCIRQGCGRTKPLPSTKS